MPQPSGNAKSSRLGRVGGVGGSGRCPIHAANVSPNAGTVADLGRSLPVGGGDPAVAPTEHVPDIDAGSLLRRNPRRRTNSNLSRSAAVVVGQLPDRNRWPVALGVQTADGAAVAATGTTAGWAGWIDAAAIS